MNAHIRLTPVASSRKVHVLAFVRDYHDRFGCSPTIGEISAHQGISTARVREVLRSLEREGQIERIRGVRRGLVLPDRIAQAVKLLSDLGWSVHGDLRHIIPLPTSHLPLSALLGQIDAAEGDRNAEEPGISS